MKKKTAIIGIAAFAAFGLCFSASAEVMTPEEREAKRVEIKADRDVLKAEREERNEERKELREGIKEERGERKEEREENREERKAERCKRVESRIQTRVGRYENKQEQHRNVFGKVVTRVESIILKLKDKGLDTSKLASDLSTLKEKVKDLENEHEEFIAGLNATESHACGESEGEFKNQLGEARKMSTEVRSKLVEVRTYYQTVVRADILELKNELLETATEDQETE